MRDDADVGAGCPDGVGDLGRPGVRMGRSVSADAASKRLSHRVIPFKKRAIMVPEERPMIAQ